MCVFGCCVGESLTTFQRQSDEVSARESFSQPVPEEAQTFELDSDNDRSLTPPPPFAPEISIDVEQSTKSSPTFLPSDTQIKPKKKKQESYTTSCARNAAGST